MPVARETWPILHCAQRSHGLYFNSANSPQLTLTSTAQEPGTYPGAPGADTESPLGNDDVLSMKKARRCKLRRRHGGLVERLVPPVYTWKRISLTGARAKAWCLLIHTETSLSLSQHLSANVATRIEGAWN